MPYILLDENGNVIEINNGERNLVYEDQNKHRVPMYSVDKVFDALRVGQSVGTELDDDGKILRFKFTGKRSTLQNEVELR